MEWFTDHNINVLPWAARSPDMNPVENIWGYMVKQIYSYEFRPRNRQELLDAITNEWQNLENYDFGNLVASMPRRLDALLDANGGYTKY